MIIQSSEIMLTSNRTYSERYSRQESLRAWVGVRRPQTEQSDGSDNRSGTNIQDIVSVSTEGQAASLFAAEGKTISADEQTAVTEKLDMKKLLEDIASGRRAVRLVLRPTANNISSFMKKIEKNDKTNQDDEELSLDPELAILKKIAEELLGTQIKVFHIDAEENQSVAAQTGSSESVNNQKPVGWGIEYSLDETYTESEQTNFAAQGMVHTADGQDIAISLNLAMSREYVESRSENIRAGDALIDPLVINYGGQAAELAGEKIIFDLNADGVKENISFVGSGSGFLVVDKNGDGKVNDGRELFGPSSGDGFSELAAYDSDGNQWIDENDANTKNLRLWTQTSGGQTKLITLQEAGVGAIFIGRVSTQFALKDEQNKTLGQIASSGIFLSEAGKAGTIQQIDLAV